MEIATPAARDDRKEMKARDDKGRKGFTMTKEKRLAMTERERLAMTERE